MRQLNHKKKRQKLLKRAIDQESGVAGIIIIVAPLDRDANVDIRASSANLAIEDEVAILELMLKNVRAQLVTEKQGANSENAGKATLEVSMLNGR